MGIYIKLFDTTAQYNTYTADTTNFILPNVSLAKDAPTTVHYNPLSPTPPTPTHDYVEIGGIKWATMNIGATGVTDTGLYFQWADTQGYTAAQVGDGEGQKYFDCEDYKYAELDPSSSNGSGSGSGGEVYRMTKYNETDGKTLLDLSDDAAQANLGGSWRMPTTAEFQALGTATSSAWTADYEGSGVAGLVLTSNEDSSKKLFFPAAGYCYDGSVSSVGSGSWYWSSSLSSNGVSYAYDMSFGSNYVAWGNDSSRCLGYSVRGILDE